jgi:hypothetical protein
MRSFCRRNKRNTMSAKSDSAPEQTIEMPAIPHRVLHADVPFYSDPDCTKLVSDASILVVRSLDPHEPVRELDIVPVRKHYAAGQIVSWELNNKKLWERCWFRNPESGLIEQAWTYHVEFIGKVVHPDTVRQHAEHLAKLEKAMGSP